MRAGLAAVSCLLALSCERGVTGEGYGQLTVNMGFGSPEEIQVKSPTAPPADMVFSLSIVSQDLQHTYTVDDHRTLAAEPLTLPAGTYTVTASTGTPSNARWESPCYSGSASVLVKPEQKATANIVASLSDTKVTVNFEDPIPEMFSEYSVSFSNGTGDPLVFDSAAGNLGAAAYFAVTGSLTYELNMVNVDGTAYSLGPITLDDVKVNQHYRFTFTIDSESDDQGRAFFTIIVDDSVNTVTYELNLDFSDEHPEVSADFPITNEITIPKGNETSRVLSFKASRGIASLVLHHGDAGLLELGMPQWTDLVASQEVSALQQIGIDCNLVPFGSLEATVDMTDFISSLEIGNYSFMTTVIDTKNSYDQVVFNLHVISPVDAEAVEARPWAKFAIIKGVWFDPNRPAGLGFQYRKASDSAWTDYSGDISFDDATKQFSAELCSLEPLTTYVFRAVSDKDKDTKEISFTTEGAPTVPNLSFDNWYKDGSCWYPNASSSVYVWDSANPGTSSLGVTPTTPEESDVVSGKAARLESATAMGMFAAGNLYIGQFDGLAGLGAKLKWGYQFTGRPIALVGYYKYTPKNIDKAQAPYTSLQGQPDNCSIRIWLTTWTSQFNINTSTKTFLSDDDPSIVASASLYSDVSNPSYVRFVLPIEYRDNTAIPTYIEIACAASRYGDYFTGGVGSVLRVDEFELIYDPYELTEEERALVGYRN